MSLLASCATPTPETITETVIETVVVEVDGETIVETVEVEKEVVVEKEVEVPVEGPTTITVWSHFANEPNFRQVISGVFEDYMAEHPDVVIEVAWFDKQPLRDSIRTVMQSGGEGAPDFTTFDHEDVEWVEAGWLEPFDGVLDFNNFVVGADVAGSYPALGMPEHYKFNMAAQTDYILYNKEIFSVIRQTVFVILNVFKTARGAFFT